MSNVLSEEQINLNAKTSDVCYVFGKHSSSISGMELDTYISENE